MLIRLAAIQSEFLAGVAYVDCLDDSVETLERELVDRRSKNELYLTFGSIGLGAAAATTQGVLEVSDRDSNMAPVVGIAGGVSSAALGIAALLWPAPTVWLNHDINVLRSVWTGSDTGGLPLFVWRLLLIPRPNGESPREALKKRWKVMLNDRSADQGRQLEDLLFGAGGHYDLNALEFRETMLDQLETEIELMNRDLQNMTEFVALHYGIRT